MHLDMDNNFSSYKTDIMDKLSQHSQTALLFSVMIASVLFSGLKQDIITNQLYSALCIIIGLNLIRISENKIK
jgi:hypothetical protein